MTTALPGTGDPVLPPPFATPTSPDGLRPTEAVQHLVRSQVMALLESSPAYHQLEAERRTQMAEDLVKIASYSAALMQDIFLRSQQLGQTPAVLTQAIVPGSPAEARSLAGKTPPPPPDTSDQFSPRAAGNVARITQQTLNAIAFPTFVADLIKGTFQAIVDASIQQMEAYGDAARERGQDRRPVHVATTSPTTRPATTWSSDIPATSSSTRPGDAHGREGREGDGRGQAPNFKARPRPQRTTST